MKISLFIASRYLLSKKSTQAVNIILWISIGAFCIASASMFVVMSVFSGLRQLNIKNMNNLNSELKIEAKQGKQIKDLYKIISILEKNQKIKYFSRVIDEKIYILNNEKDQVAYIKGVDENYNKIISIDSLVIYGKYPDFIYQNEINISNDLAYRLDIVPNKESYSILYMPKKGTGIIKSEEDAFQKKEVYTTGILNDSFTNTIICPIDLIENLLESEKPIAYSIIIKLKPNQNENEIKDLIQTQIGEKYIVKNRFEQDEAFIKMMNIEQLMIYLIFILIIIISSFNLAGAIIIIIIDKTKQNQALISMGFLKNNLKTIYFYLGLLISILGSIIGIFLGLIIIFLQQKYSLVMANAYLPFPVKIESINFILVFFTITIFGIFISWIASRKLKYSN